MTTQTNKCRFATAVALCAGLFLVPALASAHPHSHPRLKGKIDALKAEVGALTADVARETNILKSQLDYQARRTESLAPGTGAMCGDPCTNDSDDDGIGDCDDVCPCDDNAIDTDHDGNADCYDPCPNDGTDACANPCGNDGDDDGVNDCDDPCPYDPANPVDSDDDGVFDCQDACPHNANNDDCYAECEWDQDGDGLADCADPCPWVPEQVRASRMHGDDPASCPMPHH